MFNTKKGTTKKRADMRGIDRERENETETIMIIKVYSFLTVVFMQYVCRCGCSFVHAIHFNRQLRLITLCIHA